MNNVRVVLGCTVEAGGALAGCAVAQEDAGRAGLWRGRAGAGVEVQDGALEPRTASRPSAPRSSCRSATS